MIGIFLLDNRVSTMDSKYFMKSYDLEHGMFGEWKTISSGSMSKGTLVSKYIVDSHYRLRISYSAHNFCIEEMAFNLFSIGGSSIQHKF